MKIKKPLFIDAIALAGFCLTSISPTLHAIAYLNADQSAYQDGENPVYTIQGAPPGSRIRWVSVKNGTATGEGDNTTNQGEFYGDYVGADGTWQRPGGTWNNSTLNGFWEKKAIFDDGSAATITFQVGAKAKPAPTPVARNAISVTNWGGHYSPDVKDTFTEGMNRVQNLGAQSIYVSMTSRSSPTGACRQSDPTIQDYPGTDFGSPSSLTAMAQTQQFQDLFSRPFQTYIINAMPFSVCYPMKDFDPAKVRQEMSNFVAYLSKTYAGKGKHFIIKDWENDWQLQSSPDRLDANVDATPDQIQHMRDWLTARDDGVVAGRKAAGKVSGVEVSDAIEFNALGRAMRYQTSILRDVLPYVKSDYVSYSAWDSVSNLSDDPAEAYRSIRNDISFIQNFRAPDGRSALNGRPLMIGEYGFSSLAKGGAAGAAQKTKVATQAFLDAGISIMNYWQMTDGGPTIADYGMGLMNADGTTTPSYQALQDFIYGLPASAVSNVANSSQTPRRSPQRPRSKSQSGFNYFTSSSSPRVYLSVNDSLKTPNAATPNNPMPSVHDVQYHTLAQ